MYSEFSGEVGSGKRPQSPVSLRGEVVAHSEKGVRVRVGRQVIQLPLSSSPDGLPVGSRVQLLISPSGEVQVLPAKGDGIPAPLSQDLLLALSGSSTKAAAYVSTSARPSLWGVVRDVASLPAPQTSHSTVGRGQVLLTLDVGDSQIRGQYSGKVEVGDVLHFNLQPLKSASGGFHITPLNSVSAEASHSANIMAYEALLPFRGEPFFAQSVSDFAAFLKSSPAFAGDRFVVPPQWEGTAQQWVQQLLGMFAASTGLSQEALNAWILWQNQPREMEKALAQWSPAGETPQNFFLLHADLPLVRGEGAASQDIITLRELWQNPQRLDTLSTSTEDKQLLRQLVQAFQTEHATGGQREVGGENFGLSYAWQEGHWRKIKVRWRASGGKKKKEGEQNFRISTEGRHLGRVEVDLNLQPAGARLNILTQHHDIREHLPEAVRSLEKKLSHLDFKVMSWHWEPWREKKVRESGVGIPRDPLPGDPAAGDVDLIV